MRVTCVSRMEGSRTGTCSFKRHRRPATAQECARNPVLTAPRGAGEPEPVNANSRVSPGGVTATVAPGIRPRQRSKCHALAICCIDDTYSDMLGVGTERVEHSVLSGASREQRAKRFGVRREAPLWMLRGSRIAGSSSRKSKAAFHAALQSASRIALSYGSGWSAFTARGSDQPSLASRRSVADTRRRSACFRRAGS